MATTKQGERIKAVIPILFAVITAVLSCLLLVHTMKSSRYVRDIEAVNTICERMSTKLSADYAYADLLELAVRYRQGKVTEDDFDLLARMAIDDNPSIGSLQLAPKGVVTYIYPTEGNEAALGHRLLEDPERKMYVGESIDTGKIVTQGPVMSLQGSLMLFGRKAIMLDGKFWGVAIVAIDFDGLIEECGLNDDSLGFDYAIATYKSDNSTPDYVYGDNTVLENADVYNEFQPNDCKWRVAVKYKLDVYALLLSYGVYVLASFLIGIAVYAIIKTAQHSHAKSKKDPLTNTINISEFRRLASNRLKNSKDSVCAMLSVELDGYREIENIYGHSAGDRVLVYSAERIRSAIRTDDLISRAGEYEFLILLSDIGSEEQVIKVIERIRELCEQYILLSDGETKVNVFLSVGYAISSPDGSDYMVLYKTADERMSADKCVRRGRG